MKIVVFGAGALGGYYGGRLAQHGVPVTFLVREARFAMLAQRGLRVQSVHGDFAIEPVLATQPEEIDGVDVILLGLKNYHITAAMPALTKLVGQGGVILPMQNGIRHVDRLLAEFGPAHVMGGVSQIEATLGSDGDVIQTSNLHHLIYGSLGHLTDTWLDKLDATLARGEFPCQRSDQIRIDMWQKYIFLATFSGITAATRLPIGRILQDDKAREFLLGLIEEVVSIAKTQVTGLPDDTLDQIVNRLYRVEPTMTSSLHRDLEKGRPLELEDLQGVLLEMAAATHQTAPNLTAVYRLLHPHLHGHR